MALKHYNSTRSALIVLFSLLVLYLTFSYSQAENSLFSNSINVSVIDLDSTEDKCNDCSLLHTSTGTELGTEFFGSVSNTVFNKVMNLAANFHCLIPIRCAPLRGRPVKQTLAALYCLVDLSDH